MSALLSSCLLAAVGSAGAVGGAADVQGLFQRQTSVASRAGAGPEPGPAEDEAGLDGLQPWPSAEDPLNKQFPPPVTLPPPVTYPCPPAGGAADGPALPLRSGDTIWLQQEPFDNFDGERRTVNIRRCRWLTLFSSCNGDPPRCCSGTVTENYRTLFTIINDRGGGSIEDGQLVQLKILDGRYGDRYLTCNAWMCDDRVYPLRPWTDSPWTNRFLIYKQSGAGGILRGDTVSLRAVQEAGDGGWISVALYSGASSSSQISAGEPQDPRSCPETQRCRVPGIPVPTRCPPPPHPDAGPRMRPSGPGCGRSFWTIVSVTTTTTTTTTITTSTTTTTTISTTISTTTTTTGLTVHSDETIWLQSFEVGDAKKWLWCDRGDCAANVGSVGLSSLGSRIEIYRARGKGPIMNGDVVWLRMVGLDWFSCDHNSCDANSKCPDRDGGAPMRVESPGTCDWDRWTIHNRRPQKAGDISHGNHIALKSVAYGWLQCNEQICHAGGPHGHARGTEFRLTSDQSLPPIDIPTRTCGGNANGAACVVPFVWNGKIYDECTDADHDEFWCYTGSRLWGNCLC